MHLPYALRSLRHRNLRLFFGGQTVSLVGTWMQAVAQGWLVYRLTRSASLLGVVGFLSQVPIFFFGVYAGALADRVPRRRIVLVTQINAVVQATLLAAVTLTGVVRPWMLLPLALMLGLSNAFEVPARQSLLGEIAGPDMPNALALNSSIVNGARAVGPALAGWTVAAVGEGACFAINAVSFAGTLWALVVMDLPARPMAPPSSRRGHLLEGVAYAGKTPHVRALLALLGTTSFFAMPYITLLPAFTKEVLGGGARMLGTLQGAAGLGALVAGVSLLVRTGLTGLGRRVGVGATVFGVGLAGLALSRNATVAALCLVLVGFGFLSQSAGTMTLLQGLAPEGMRGRVMGFFSTLFLGTTPFGALLGGFAAERFGVARVFLAASVVVLLASTAFHLALPSLRRVVLSQYPTLFPPQVPP